MFHYQSFVFLQPLSLYTLFLPVLALSSSPVLPRHRLSLWQVAQVAPVNTLEPLLGRVVL